MASHCDIARNIIEGEVGFQPDEMAVSHISVVARDNAAGETGIGVGEFAGWNGDIDIRPGYAEGAARIPAKPMIGRTLRNSLRAWQT